MSAIQRIKDRLQLRPEWSYRVTGQTITVDPPSTHGFAVSLTEGASEWVVSFDGWHEHFASEDEAVNCFAFGLSDQCRLRVDYRGSFPHRWTVETRAGDGWLEDSTTGMLLFPFWRRRRVEYRQNVIARAEGGHSE